MGNPLLTKVNPNSSKATLLGYTLDKALALDEVASDHNDTLFLVDNDLEDTTINFLQPNILQAVRRSDSIVAFDNGWLYGLFAPYLRECGYEVFQFVIDRFYNKDCTVMKRPLPLCDEWDPFDIFRGTKDDPFMSDLLASTCTSLASNTPAIIAADGMKDTEADAMTLAWCILKVLALNAKCQLPHG